MIKKLNKTKKELKEIEKEVRKKIRSLTYRECSERTGFTVGYFCNISKCRTKLSYEQVLFLADKLFSE